MEEHAERLELPGGSKRYHKVDYAPEKIDALLVDVFIESHAQQPKEIVLDLDATDIPLHGHQPERFFHGYYDDYCYLPLYIFAGDQLLCAAQAGQHRWRGRRSMKSSASWRNCAPSGRK